MPPGKANAQAQGSTKVKRKPEAIEKVREIKQRQQNWLLQREQSKHTDSPKPRQVTSSIKSVPQQRSSAANIHLRNQSKQEETAKPQVKKEFNHWIKSRHKASDDYNKNDYNDSNSVCSGAESELERLVSPDIDILKEPVSEDQFGDLANEIASRVKQDLGISQRNTPESNSDFQSDCLDFVEESIEEELAWKSGRCHTYTQEAPSFNHLGTSGLTSHSCTVCNRLMLSSSHIPMMVIPCGHTLCKACSGGRKFCPACKCSVVSLTLNVMLQQVIQEYHSYPVPSTTTLKSTPHSVKTDNSLRGSSFVEDNRRNRNVSYQSQLLSLQTRYEVLSKEHNSLSTHLDAVTNKISNGQTQAKNIASQENEVKKAIQDLQERLLALQEHRKQYKSQLIDLCDEKTEVDAKITLLSGTLSSLSREIEKVKLLAEGERDTG